MMKKFYFYLKSFLFLFFFLVLMNTSAYALIIDAELTFASNGGTYVELEPPFSLYDYQYAHNDLLGFNEDQFVTTAVNIPVNVLSSGGSYIPQGTDLSSHFFAFYQGTIAGWIEFDGDVLGIQTGQNYLKTTTSYFRVPGVQYQIHGIDPSQPEWAVIDSSNPRKVNFKVSAGYPWGDHFRVLTEPSSNAVPEPATMLLFGTGLIGFVFKRRRA